MEDHPHSSYAPFLLSSGERSVRPDKQRSRGVQEIGVIDPKFSDDKDSESCWKKLQTVILSANFWNLESVGKLTQPTRKVYDLHIYDLIAAQPRIVPNENAVLPRTIHSFCEHLPRVADICCGPRASRWATAHVSVLQDQIIDWWDRGSRWSGFSGSPSFVTVMQPAELGQRHDSPHFR
jgi:hypothetical protein